MSESSPGAPLSRGFTLIEMLVVIAIISLLLTAAGPVFDSLAATPDPGAAAGVVAGQLERARTHARSRNSYVWVRLGTVAENPDEFFIGIYEAPDGTADPAAAKGVWTAPRIANLRLSSSLDASFKRPEIADAGRPDLAAWVRFSPGGEARLIDANPLEKRAKLKPPAGEGALLPWMELGLQPTRRGIVPESAKQDVASVQLSGITGRTLEFSL